MRIVSANELQNWLQNGEVLEQDSHGPKVVHLADGSFLKIFRSRRPLLARWLPEAVRFQRNAERLQQLGIPTPQIEECAWLNRDQVISACRYQPLAGTPLDKLFHQQRPLFDAQLPALAAYIHSLHQKGIYFRSLHLGNILLTAERQFGLIDFLDIRFKRGPLRRALVRRNFAHLQNYLQRRKVQNFPWDELLAAYRVVSSSPA